MENEIYSGTITVELISAMKVGQTLKVPADKHEVASTRMSEVNTASRIFDKSNPKRWTLFSRTKELGYVTITRIK